MLFASIFPIRIFCLFSHFQCFSGFPLMIHFKTKRITWRIKWITFFRVVGNVYQFIDSETTKYYSKIYLSLVNVNGKLYAWNYIHTKSILIILIWCHYRIRMFSRNKFGTSISEISIILQMLEGRSIQIDLNASCFHLIMPI